MICPNCGSNVPDGALECPSCHAQLGLTQRIVIPKESWCPVCGALVAPGADACPKCGSPTGTGRPQTRTYRKLRLPEISEAAGDAGERDVARIESAIPPATPDPTSPVARHDRLPRMRTFMLAAGLAVLVVGGAAVLITHPWDSEFLSIKATQPADTSMAGFPGQKEALSGQDGKASQSDEDTVFQSISDAYDKLGELAERVDASEQAFDEGALSSDLEARKSGQADANALSIEVSNLITDISNLDSGAGTYTQDIDHLSSLGNWLRNRMDAVTAGWSASVASQDLAADKDKIFSAVQANRDGSGQSSYKTHFDQNYDSWKPTKS